MYHLYSILFLAGCLIVGLIREFLTFYNLEFTQAVFEPEVGLPVSLSTAECHGHALGIVWVNIWFNCNAQSSFQQSEQLETRTDLAREFNVIESEETSKLPLLVEVMRRGSDTGHRLRSSTEVSARGHLLNYGEGVGHRVSVCTEILVPQQYCNVTV